VFCHSDLVRQAVDHVFDELLRQDPAHPGAAAAAIEVSTVQAGQILEVRFRGADRTIPETSLAATERLSEQLADFGGRLEYRETAPGLGSEMVLALRRWAPIEDGEPT
jgi:hypothetical protein